MSVRKAKILATIGPSSNKVSIIEQMILAGMNAARVNMSHGTYEAHAETVKNIREASKKTKREVAIILDLQGPKIRVDKLKENLKLQNSQEWVIGPSHVKDQYPEYKECFIPTIYKDLVKDAHVGATILFDDGLIEAKAIEKDREVLKIKIVVGGELKSNKGINLPFVKVSAPSFTDKDQEDLMFGLKQGVDYVALSFVRTAKDIYDVKTILHKMRISIPIISKIEKPEAIDNIKEILEVTDLIMIARGDMGVEVGNHLVPSIQKNLIKACNNKGIPVITATQMLESMITNSRPTRAEASDVANAVWDGTDVVMLSGETASGAYPVEAVKMMSQIIEEAEKTPRDRPPLRTIAINSVSASTQVAAAIIAEKNNARWILSITQSGNSCLQMTRFRPTVRVLGVTNSVPVLRKMCLFWGITPYYTHYEENEEHTLHLDDQVLTELKTQGLLINGDKAVITIGDGRYFQQGTTNSIRVEIIKDVPKAIQNRDQETIQEVIVPQGKILLDTTICASCQACVEICPHHIWEVRSDHQDETRISVVNAIKCTVEMECIRVCPTGAIEIIPSER
jgi:pyruvate kinase